MSSDSYNDKTTDNERIFYRKNGYGDVLGERKKTQKTQKNPHHHHHHNNNKTKTNSYLILLAVNHSCKNLSHSAQGRPQAKSAVPRKPKMMCLTVDHTAICSCFCRDVCLSGSGGEIPSFSAAG